MFKTTNSPKGKLHSLGELLAKRQPQLKKSQTSEKQSYTQEFQVFGDWLTRELGDEKRRGLYMKLAKNEQRSLLEKALYSIADTKARNKAALFMWKLGQMREREGGSNPKEPKFDYQSRRGRDKWMRTSK